MAEQPYEVLKKYLTLLSAKRIMLRMTPDIRTLAVGSSHGDFSFNPAWCESSFNLCCRSQDLKYSYLLYRKMAAVRPDIRNIVVFYSVFSPGSFLEKSPSEREISIALNEIFWLDVEYENPQLAAINEAVKGKFSDLAAQVTGSRGFLPKDGKGFFPESYGAARRASEHLKSHARGGADIYLDKIFEIARAQRHKVVIVISPARSDYKACIGSSEHLFDGLRGRVTAWQPHVDIDILDLYHTTEFADSDFADFDHLKPNGAGVKIVSSRISHLVNGLPATLAG